MMKKKYCCEATRSLYTDYYVDQAGNGSLPVFQGVRGQRGHGFGSVLSGLFRSAAPMLKRIGKTALTTGAQIASDLLGGKSFSESARSRVRQGINSFLPPEDDSEQTGSGHKRRKLINSGKRKRGANKAKGRKKKPRRDIFY
jgi:hypothetical protein